MHYQYSQQWFKFVSEYILMKFRLQSFLMLLTILAVAGFQFFWLKQTYDREQVALLAKADYTFRDVIQQLQVSKLKLDSFSIGDTSEIKKIERVTKDSVKQEFTVRLNQKKGIVSTINVISKKINDTPSPEIRKLLYVGKDHSVIDGNNGQPDEFPGEMQTKDRLIRVLYGVDSLQDSIRISEIDTALSKGLSKQNITIPFKILRVDSTYKSGGLMNPVTVGFSHPVNYFLKLENKFPYLLKRISLPILFSVLLLGITIFSFLLLYRNLQQQKKLTAIKNEFIANITHELKTPIATVSVAIEAMKNFDALQSPERTQEYLDISANELQRLSLLVDKVLSLSKFERNEIEIKKEPFDLVQLIQEVIDSMKLQFEKQKAVTSLQLQGTNFNIKADQRHISSVLYNLLDNALKYSLEEPRIHVQVIDQSTYIEIRVSDNGIGIPHEYNRKIFEQFFRVPSGDKHNIKGYGLGLSYVNYIVGNHHGSIEVESELGKGSTFIVKLPFEETENYKKNSGL
ncbi:MAG: HAMP domain-containing sensor histidine kinase [Ferruginibacter sp.]